MDRMKKDFPAIDVTSIVTSPNENGGVDAVAVFEWMKPDLDLMSTEDVAKLVRDILAYKYPSNA